MLNSCPCSLKKLENEKNQPPPRRNNKKKDYEEESGKHHWQRPASDELVIHRDVLDEPRDSKDNTNGGRVYEMLRHGSTVVNLLSKGTVQEC